MAKNGLAELLGARQKDDAVYRLSIELLNLHAVQGRNDGLTKVRAQTMSEIADTRTSEGTPEGDSALPTNRRRNTRKVKEREIQTYRFERSGKPGTIMLQIGGPYGLFAKALRDAACAKGKARYLDYMQSLALIRFVTVDGVTEDYIEVKAVTTTDALDREKALPDGHPGLPRMEPRNKPGGKSVMVPVFHERLAEPVRVAVHMVVNAECPRSEEEIAGLLHGMQGVPFGPAKRGLVRIVKVERVKAAA